jgi:hypothetical protein
MQLLNRPFYFQEDWQMGDGSYPQSACVVTTSFAPQSNLDPDTQTDDRFSSDDPND